ncbi:hypothetical protein [Treponema pedis]|uniref:beta-sandwich lipoprotein n=1 Tax=Treponema pedis TaxID=409322 RepID=UPI0031430FA3
MKKLFIFLAVILSLCITCCREADVARHNLEIEEQNFNVYRRAVFYNGITNDYILLIEGYLAVTIDNDGDLVVTVKTDEGTYLKHYLGLSDNVTYFSEQLIPSSVSNKRYKVIFKPSVIIPDIELK